jgi:hypothetical protein
MVFNKFRLGADWFERGITEDVVRVLHHELGQQYSPDHVSTQYYGALCRIGAKVFLLAGQGSTGMSRRSPAAAAGIAEIAFPSSRLKPRRGECRMMNAE